MVANIASLFFRDPIKLYERLCKYSYLYSFLAFMRTEFVLFIWLAHIIIRITIRHLWPISTE